MEKKKKEDKYYLPRDISWMYFNRRILQEAMKERVPILERLSFLGIYSNNLDEFFRVRVATQSRVAECEDKAAHSEREEALKLIRQINKLNNRYSKEYEGAIKQVTAELEKENIYTCLFRFTALGQLLVAQPHVDGTFRDIDLDDIPVSHQSDSATGSGLGRDMPDRKTGRTATETTIRDQGALLT